MISPDIAQYIFLGAIFAALYNLGQAIKAKDRMQFNKQIVWFVVFGIVAVFAFVIFISPYL